MFKLISIMFEFLKELIFDSKEEYNITSSKFNTRKFTTFTILSISLSLNAFLMYRMYCIAKINLTNKATNVEILIKEKKDLQEKLVGCEQKLNAKVTFMPSEKNKDTAPSDVRNQ